MGEKCSDKFWPRIRLPRNSRDLLHAANLRHGTDGFTSPPKEGTLKIFFALKNPTASAGFEPANLGTKGQHATSRPPKPIICMHTFIYFSSLNKVSAGEINCDYVLENLKLIFDISMMYLIVL